MNLFILLNQVECLELGLSDSFMRDVTATQIVRPGELLDVHVLFGIIGLFFLGRLLPALEPIIILPFKVSLTHIKALKFAVRIHPLADKLVQVNFGLLRVGLLFATKLVFGVT